MRDMESKTFPYREELMGVIAELVGVMKVSSAALLHVKGCGLPWTVTLIRESILIGSKTAFLHQFSTKVRIFAYVITLIH